MCAERRQRFRDAMGPDAAEVGCDEHIGAERGVGVGEMAREEDRCCEFTQRVCREPNRLKGS